MGHPQVNENLPSLLLPPGFSSFCCGTTTSSSPKAMASGLYGCLPDADDVWRGGGLPALARCGHLGSGWPRPSTATAGAPPLRDRSAAVRSQTCRCTSFSAMRATSASLKRFVVFWIRLSSAPFECDDMTSYQKRDNNGFLSGFEHLSERCSANGPS